LHTQIIVPSLLSNVFKNESLAPWARLLPTIPPSTWSKLRHLLKVNNRTNMIGNMLPMLSASNEI
jgi:hypothetical protein